MVYLGASLIALSLMIMYGLIIHTETMSEIFSVETWFVISVILAPVGYVVQDVVADAMTVEADPLSDEEGIRVIGINYKDDPKKTIQWLKDMGNPYSNEAVYDSVSIMSHIKNFKAETVLGELWPITVVFNF